MPHKTGFLFLLAILTTTALTAQPQRVAGTLLVQTGHPEQLPRLLSDLGSFEGADIHLSFAKEVSGPMGVYLLTYDEDAIVNPRHFLNAVRAHPVTDLAQFNHRLTLRCQQPDDPQFVNQWQHRNNGVNGALPDADIDSDLAWQITSGGTTAMGDTIVVCVIEGGNLNHPDLNANAWVNHVEIPENGLDDDGNGYTDDYLGWNVQSQSDEGVYEGGHGTQVMGMVGAKGGNGIGVIGANQNVKIMSVAGQNTFDEASVVAAYTYPLVMRKLYNETGGSTGAFVVATNASWGLDFGNPNDVPLWAAVYDSLGAQGILNCAATSNSNVNVDEVGDIPTAVTSDYMIAVTASNSADQRTFSAFGPTSIDLAAPGEQVYTTTGYSGYGYVSGTSFASPLTAGVIALLYSVPCPEFAQWVLGNPQAAADYVRQMLLEGTDAVPSMSGETFTGGRLNAFNSTLAIMESCGDDVCLPPLGLYHTVASDTVYTFHWTSLDSTAFDLRFKAVDDDAWAVVNSLGGGSFTLDTLSPCTDYVLEMRSTCSVDTTFPTCVEFTTNGCCVPPAEFELLNTSDTGVVLAWPHVFGVSEYEVFIGPVGSPPQSLGTVADTSMSLSGLEACTPYAFLIRPTCNSDTEYGLQGEFTTTGCGACLDMAYCPAGGEDSDFEYIDEVSIGDFSMDSGNDGGYALFENSGLTLVPGDTLPIVLSPGFGFQSYEEFFKVWVDLDGDGAFSDSEILFSSQEGSSAPVNGLISIPPETALGETRLRVSMKYVEEMPGDPDVEACETFAYGETEDYCISIGDVVGVKPTITSGIVRIFPNPSTGWITVEFEGDPSTGDNLSLELFDTSGRLVLGPRAVHGGRVDIGILQSGMYAYILSEHGRPVATGRLVLVIPGEQG